MNYDCIFNVLLYSDINNILNCLSTNKIIKKISSEYFWKLLCKREYRDVVTQLDCNTWNEKYMTLHNIDKFKNMLKYNYSVHEIFNMCFVEIEYYHFKVIMKLPHILNALNKLLALDTLFVIVDEYSRDFIDNYSKIGHITIMKYQLGGYTESDDSNTDYDEYYSDSN